MNTPPNIVLVTLDAVSALHLGCHGYKGTRTSRMDELAKESLFLETCVTQSSTTWISHASILTGCEPPRHGVRDRLRRLETDVPYLPEFLRDAGYRTGGFPSHTLLGRARGFERGFTHFSDDFSRFNMASGTEHMRQHRYWDEMFAEGREWMTAPDERPFFAWFHYMGTHWVDESLIECPETYRARFSPEGQFYDAKVSWADEHCVGGLLDFLRDSNLRDRTAVVITADHGEDLAQWQHGGAHTGMWSEAVHRVPGIVRLPGRAAERVTTLARSIDLLPTVIEHCGLSGREELFSRIDGRPVGGSRAAPEEAWTEDVNYIALRNLEEKFVLKVRPPRRRNAIEAGLEPRFNAYTRVVREAARGGRGGAVLNTILSLLKRYLLRQGRPDLWGRLLLLDPEPLVAKHLEIAAPPEYTRISEPCRNLAEEQPENSRARHAAIRGKLATCDRWGEVVSDADDRFALETVLKNLGYM